MVGQRRKAGEDVPEVGIGIEATAAAAFDDGVEDGAAVARGVRPDEEPVLFAQGGGPDRIFDEVVVDLHPAVPEIHGEGGPLPEGVSDGFPEQALGQHAVLHPDEGAVEALDDHPATAGADGGAQGRPGLLRPQLGFGLVEMLELAEEPAGELGGQVAVTFTTARTGRRFSAPWPTPRASKTPQPKICGGWTAAGRTRKCPTKNGKTRTIPTPA